MEQFLFLLNDFGANLAGWLVIALDIALIYGLYRLIKYFIRYHAECQNDFTEQREKKQQSRQKIDDINRELDKIEASLDAVTNNEKITPIWDLPRKKP